MCHKQYLPTLDGIRGIAIIAVIVYHINVNYLPGGFLGVDLFFVLSGYLIGTSLIQEYEKTGTIKLKTFYARRAKRLLPAAYAMITLLLLLMVLFNGVLLKKSHLDALFGYLYTDNWFYIFRQVDYFDTFGAQSPYKHLWSLAIEAQFYLITPILFLMVARYKRIHNQHDLNKKWLIVLVALIGVSFLTQLVLTDVNAISRVYFGTDTRAFTLLIGVLGSILFPINTLVTKTQHNMQRVQNLMAMGAMLLILLAMLFITEYSMGIYYGGFLIVAILGLIVIIFGGKPHTIMEKCLTFQPLVFIGKISYSLYLWHFPILIITTPVSELENPNLFLVTLRLILIVIAAVTSYLFLEKPIRRVGLVNWINPMIETIKQSAKNRRESVLIALGGILLLLTMGLFGQGVPFLSGVFVNDTAHQKVEQFKTDGKINEQESSSGLTQHNQSEDSVEKDIHQTDSAHKNYETIVIIGDSLTIDIGPRMQEQYPNAAIDGRISRQLSEGITVADKFSQQNHDKSAIICQLGTNGPFTESQLDEFIQKFNQADVYLVTVRVPRAWEKTVNDLLHQAANKYEKVSIIDWHNLAAGHPEYFEPDYVHLNALGIEALVTLMTQQLTTN